MLLTRKEQECTMNTAISLIFAFAALALFICTWSLNLQHFVYVESILTMAVFFLSTAEIAKNNDRLLNGVALLITTIPLVFYMLIFIMTFVTNMLF